MDGLIKIDGELVRISVPGDVHVMPNFGKAHHESASCWCGPTPDPLSLDREQYANTVWVHEVEQ